MKILWHGVSGEFHTGYGVQTKLFTKALVKAGHEVIISSIVNGCFNYTDQNDIPVVVNGPNSRMGNSLIREHVKRIRPDILLSMFDTFVCDVRQYKDAPWLSWQVVDSAPLQPKIKSVAEKTPMRLAMSRFGQRTLKEAGLDSEYVPLALDPETYHMVDRQIARAYLMKMWGRRVPKFLAVIVAANMSTPSRKNFHGAFKAWKRFNESHPDSLLYVHTENTGTMGSGENLIQLADSCGMNPDILMFPDQYGYAQQLFPDQYLRTLYSAADVYLCSSLGEGFGVPLIDAQACGCPVIAPAATATHELVFGPGGTRIMNCSPIIHHGISELMLPDYGEMADALSLYASTPVDLERRKAIAATVISEYSIDNVMQKYLLPVLAKAGPIMKQYLSNGSANGKKKKKESTA